MPISSMRAAPKYAQPWNTVDGACSGTGSGAASRVKASSSPLPVGARGGSCEIWDMADPSGRRVIRAARPSVSGVPTRSGARTPRGRGPALHHVEVLGTLLGLGIGHHGTD